jgi:hypothetical protein
MCAAGWVIAGRPGLAGAAIATLIVVVFLSSGLAPVLIAGRPQVPPSIGLAVLLVTYTLRLALVLLAVALIMKADFIDVQWLGVTIVACALTWSAAHFWHAVRRSKTELTIEPETPEEPGAGTGVDHS